VELSTDEVIGQGHHAYAYALLGKIASFV